MEKSVSAERARDSLKTNGFGSRTFRPSRGSVSYSMPSSSVFARNASSGVEAENNCVRICVRMTFSDGSASLKVTPKFWYKLVCSIRVSTLR